jgi:hypothetical protein
MKENTNVDWNKELQDLDSDEKDEALFDVTTEHIERLIGKWMETPMYAKPEDDGEVLVGSEPDEMAHETTLGQIAAVPLLNLIIRTAGEMSKEDSPVAWFEGNIKESSDLILDLLKSVMTEGIMIANAPGLRSEFDQILTSIRELED